MMTMTMARTAEQACQAPSLRSRGASQRNSTPFSTWKEMAFSSHREWCGHRPDPSSPRATALYRFYSHKVFFHSEIHKSFCHVFFQDFCQGWWSTFRLQFAWYLLGGNASEYIVKFIMLMYLFCFWNFYSIPCSSVYPVPPPPLVLIVLILNYVFTSSRTNIKSIFFYFVSILSFLSSPHEFILLDES